MSSAIATKPGVSGFDSRLHDAEKALVDLAVLCPHQFYSSEREAERQSRESLDLRFGRRMSEESLVRRHSRLLLEFRNISRYLAIHSGRGDQEVYKETISGYQDLLERAYCSLEASRIRRDIKDEYLALAQEAGAHLYEAGEDARPMPTTK